MRQAASGGGHVLGSKDTRGSFHAGSKDGLAPTVDDITPFGVDVDDVALKMKLGSDGYPYTRKIYFVVGDRLVEGRRHAESTTAKYRIDKKLFIISIFGLSLHDSRV